jgi:uncharacterized protein YecT (DUF1311 family)
MRHSVWAGLLSGLMLLGAVPGLAQGEPEVNCDSPQTTLEMNICAGRSQRASEAAMQAAYQKVRQAYRDQMAENAAIPELKTYSNQRLQALAADQQAWLKYRKTHCNWASSKFAGGTIRPSIEASCLTRLNQERSQVLLADLEEG